MGRQVFLLALPMLGEQLVNFLIGLVDTWLAGHISKEATGAVGTASYVGWFASMSFMLVGTGASALVSRSIGARDHSTASAALHQSFILALGFGVGFSLLVFFGASGLAALLAPTPAAGVLFVRFLRIDAWGYILYSLLLIGASVSRAAGDTRTPMRIMIAVNVVNAGLAAAFVFALNWGVTGIAIATLISRCLGGIIMCIVAARGICGMRLAASGFRPHGSIMWRMLRVGLPAAGDGALMWISQLAFIAIVARSGAGEIAAANYAAHTIAMRVEALTYLPAVAWMTAAATLVGQYLGARRPELAARVGHVAAMQGALLTSVVGAAFVAFAAPIFGLMSQDASVRAVGIGPFRLLGLVQPILCMAIVYIGALRGAGDTRATMFFSLIGGLLVRVPVAYFCAITLGWGLLGAWLGMWADNVLKFSLGLARFARGKWKQMRV